MATPKIRIKRGTIAPTSTNLPSSGELAIDTTNKKFYIQADSAGSASPLWMGSPIDDSTWNNNSNLATQSLIESKFMLKSGGTFTGTVSGTSFSSSGTVTTKVLKLEDPADNDFIQIKAPSLAGNSYTLTLPASLTAGVMKTDISGNVSFSTDSIGVDIKTAGTSGTYYPMLASGIGTGVSEVYIDNTAGFGAVNGPLAYTPSTGTLTINGDLNVNGQAAAVTLTASNYGSGSYPSSLVNAVNFIHVNSVTGVYIGDIIEIVTSSIPTGITISFSSGNSTATISAVDPATNKITVDTNFTVSGGTLSAAQSNAIQINYQSLSAKISASNSAVVNAEIFTQYVDNIKIGNTASAVAIGNNQLSTVSIGPVLNMTSNSVGSSSVINTAGATASFAPAISTIVNIGNAATTMNLGGTSTDNLTYKFGDNATANSKTKTINIGTSGVSGSTTNIVLGAQNGNNQHTVYGPITNAAGSSATGSDQLVTKGYVDTAAVGLNTKGSAVAATTGTLASITGGTISYPSATTITWTGGTAVAASTGTTLVIDGVNIYYGDGNDPTTGSGTSVVILVKDEPAAARNGLYYVSGVRTLTRISTADTAAELAKGTYIFVSGGTLNGGKGYITNAAVTTLGSDSIVWNQFTQSTTYVGSAPISVAGNSITLNYSSSSFDLNSNSLRLKSSVAGNGLTYNNEVLSVSSSITVKAATTGNVDLSTDISSVDNVSISVGDIYLVKNQTNPALNGIWQRAASGAQPTRSSLYNTQTLINGTRTIYVSSNNSSTNGGKSFTLSTPASSTVSTQSNPNAGGPILYIENNTGTSYTPDNYYTIGAPLDKTADATTKVYYLNDIYHGTASSTFTLNGNTYLTVKIAGWVSNDLRNIPADIVPGLKITKFGSADFSSYSIYINRIDRVNRTITLYNRSSTAVSSVTIASGSLADTAGSGVTLEIENPTSNSYYSTPKGILVYNKKDFSEWSALQFTPTSTSSTNGTWSIINSSSNGNTFNSTLLVGDTLTQTLKNKTLDNTNIINNSTVISPNIQTVDSARTIYSVYATDGTANAATWYTTSPAVFDVAADTYGNGTDQSFAVVGSVHNLRTGTKLTVTATGSTTNITSGTYYAIVTGPNTFKFASSYANAISGTSITRSSNSVIDQNNTIKIIASSVDITLGLGGEGSFGYIRMPSMDNNIVPYEYIFGDNRDITTTPTTINIASSSQSTAQSGDTYAFSNVTTSIGGGNVYAYDTSRTDQNVNLGVISAISGNTGSDTVTITFANTNSFTTNDWVTIAGITSTHVTAQADRKTLNYAHKVNAVASGTSVTLKLRAVLTSNINVTSIIAGTAPVAVKNYEIYFVCKNNPEFKLGASVAFSNDGTSSVNEQKIRGVYSDSDVGNGTPITYTITSLANIGGTTAKGFGIRVPYICLVNDGTTLTYGASPNNNYVGLGLQGNSTAKNSRASLTPPAETASYTGRRVLLNTLIDCGSY